jgi:hypothetical protein
MQEKSNSKKVAEPTIKKIWHKGPEYVASTIIAFINTGKNFTETVETVLPIIYLMTPFFNALLSVGDDPVAVEVLQHLVLLLNSKHVTNILSKTWDPVSDLFSIQMNAFLKFKIRQRIFELKDASFAKWIMRNWKFDNSCYIPVGSRFLFKLKRQFWHKYRYRGLARFNADTTQTLPSEIPFCDDSDEESKVLNEDEVQDFITEKDFYIYNKSTPLMLNDWEPMKRFVVEYNLLSDNSTFDFQQIKRFLHCIRTITRYDFQDGLWDSDTLPETLPFIAVCDDIIYRIRKQIHEAKDVMFTHWVLQGLKSYSTFDFMGLKRKADLELEIWDTIIDSVL